MGSNIPNGIGKLRVWMKQLVGTLGISQGGTGATALTNKGLLVAGASSVSTIAPGSTNGFPLVSDGTQWLLAGAGTVLGSCIGGDINYKSTGIQGAGVVGVANGGTGGGSWQQGRLFVATAPTTIGQLTYGFTSQFLRGNGTSAVPVWIDYSDTSIGGSLSGAQGGTGQSTYATGNLLYAASNGSALSKLVIGSANQVLTVSGTSTPVWRAPAPAFAYETDPTTAASTTEVVELTTAGSSLTLPSAPVAGTTIFIKDTSNGAAGSPHVITRGGTTDNIESGGGAATTYSLNTNMGCVGLCYFGTTWRIISKY